jgi:hypothetical protein
MASRFFREEIRAVQVHSLEVWKLGARAKTNVTHGLQHRMDRGFTPCRRGREKGRRSMHQMRMSRRLDCGWGAVHEIGTRAAVDVDIDKSGSDVRSEGFDRLCLLRNTRWPSPHATNPPRLHLDPGVRQKAVR